VRERREPDGTSQLWSERAGRLLPYRRMGKPRQKLTDAQIKGEGEGAVNTISRKRKR